MIHSGRSLAKADVRRASFRPSARKREPNSTTRQFRQPPKINSGSRWRQLFEDLAALDNLAPGGLSLVGETTLSHLQTRPDYAVSVGNALVGFIEVKAPGKGCDPRRFSDPHDKAQWVKLKSLPNLLYTDGAGFSVWRNGELASKIVLLDGEIETSGAKLKAPETLRALVADFLNWAPQPPSSAKALAAHQRAPLPPAQGRSPPKE